MSSAISNFTFEQQSIRFRLLTAETKSLFSNRIWNTKSRCFYRWMCLKLRMKNPKFDQTESLCSRHHHRMCSCCLQSRPAKDHPIVDSKSVPWCFQQRYLFPLLSIHWPTVQKRVLSICFEEKIERNKQNSNSLITNHGHNVCSSSLIASMHKQMYWGEGGWEPAGQYLDLVWCSYNYYRVIHPSWGIHFIYESWLI